MSPSSSKMSPKRPSASSHRSPTRHANDASHRRHHRTPSPEASGPSTSRVLLYVLGAYLAYGMFTREDDLSHLASSVGHHAAGAFDKARHGMSGSGGGGWRHEDDHDASGNHGWRSSSIGLPTHGRGLGGLIEEGAATSHRIGHTVDRYMHAGKDHVLSALHTAGHELQPSPSSSGGWTSYLGFPALRSFPFACHPNFFLSGMVRLLALVIVYPLVVIINVALLAVRSVSSTLLLLLWLAHPLTHTLGVLSKTFVWLPANALVGLSRLLYPLYVLVAGLTTVGATLGGMAAWIARKADRAVYSRRKDDNDDEYAGRSSGRIRRSTAARSRDVARSRRSRRGERHEDDYSEGQSESMDEEDDFELVDLDLEEAKRRQRKGLGWTYMEQQQQHHQQQQQQYWMQHQHRAPLASSISYANAGTSSSSRALRTSSAIMSTQGYVSQSTMVPPVLPRRTSRITFIEPTFPSPSSTPSTPSTASTPPSTPSTASTPSSDDDDRDSDLEINAHAANQQQQQQQQRRRRRRSIPSTASVDASEGSSSRRVPAVHLHFHSNGNGNNSNVTDGGNSVNTSGSTSSTPRQKAAPSRDVSALPPTSAVATGIRHRQRRLSATPS